MEYAFWDSSSIVPLCVLQHSTASARALTRRYGITVWWATPVEVRSAFARLARTGPISLNDQVKAMVILEDLCHKWREILAGIQIRQRAEELIDRFPLTATDALQVAAAWVGCQGHPRNRPLISGDLQLLNAARQLGFNAIEC